MRTTISSKGQVVLPAAVRRRLRLLEGGRLSVEVRGDGILLRPVVEPRRYRTARHPRSGLPVMVALKPPKRKLTAAQVASLHAELF